MRASSAGWKKRILVRILSSPSIAWADTDDACPVTLGETESVTAVVPDDETSAVDGSKRMTGTETMTGVKMVAAISGIGSVAVVTVGTLFGLGKPSEAGLSKLAVVDFSAGDSAATDGTYQGMKCLCVWIG